VLSVSALNVYYGESHVVRDVSFEVGDGETLAIMGRNGMGKSTLLKSLIGVLRARSGKITLSGRDVSAAESFDRVAAGMGYVPQGRMIFPYLTVEENILTGMETVRDRTIPGYIYDVFPVLDEMKNRKGGNLSGGQQQQLAIARALVSNPRVLVLDEPTEGIQPSIIKDIAKALNRLKAQRKFALLVSEQVLSFTMEIADRFLIIEKGAFVYEDTRDKVDSARIHAYLTI
jgi:urea transport system ATP-binding protein